VGNFPSQEAGGNSKNIWKTPLYWIWFNYWYNLPRGGGSSLEQSRKDFLRGFYKKKVEDRLMMAEIQQTINFNPKIEERRKKG
jgi:hypothetical protein